VPPCPCLWAPMSMVLAFSCTDSGYSVTENCLQKMNNDDKHGIRYAIHKAELASRLRVFE